MMIEINTDLHIPYSELPFTFSRSSGPGGQHVNKVNSRVTLWFDLKGSASLSGTQKARLFAELGNRINRKGWLWLVCYRHRSQAANRQAAILRFAELLRAALKRKRPRRKTIVGKVAKERRLADKKRRSQLKKGRGVTNVDYD